MTPQERYQKYKEKKQQYHQDNKDRIREYKREYYLRNKETQVAKTRDYYSTPENRAKKLLSKAKERAEESGLDFNLELSDITIPECCPYLGIPLTHQYGQGQLESNSSIDRIDSSKGYVKGNVQIISRLANTMKSNADIQTLRNFAQGIITVHGLEGTSVENYANAFITNLGK